MITINDNNSGKRDWRVGVARLFVAAALLVFLFSPQSIASAQMAARAAQFLLLSSFIGKSGC